MTIVANVPEETQLHVFTRERTNHLVQRYYASPAQVWLERFDDFGANLTASPGASTYLSEEGSQQIHVFVRGGDGKLWQSFWDASNWYGWFPFGDKLDFSPAVAHFDDGGERQLHVLFRAPGGALCQKWYKPGGAGWQGPVGPAGVNTAGAPSATEYENEGRKQLHVFYRGPRGSLCQLFYDAGSWYGPFTLLERGVNSSPAVVQYDHGGEIQMHVFYRTSSNTLAWYVYRPNGLGWLGPHDLGGTLTDAPAAASYFNANVWQLHVFARGPNGKLWQKFFDTKTWHGWFDFGGDSISGCPAVTAHDEPDHDLANVLVGAGGNEPSITLSGSTLAVAWNQPGGSTQPVATSTDNGQNWTIANVAVPSTLQAWGDTGLAPLPNSGFALCLLGKYPAFTFDVIAAATLSSGGWSAATNLSNTPTNFDDKALVATRGQSCAVAWDDSSAGRIMLCTSTDSGTTWNAPVQVSKQTSWCWGAVPVFASARRIYVVWNDARVPSGSAPGSIYFAASTDGGKTFAERRIAGRWDDSPNMDYYPQPDPPPSPPGTGPPPGPNGGFRLKLAPAFTRNPRNGELYVAWGDNRFNGKGAKPWDIVFARSADRGQTWTSPKRVSDVYGKFHYFPWLSCAPDGRLDLVYLSRRMSPLDAGSDLFCQSSWDGGLTWTRAQRVSSLTSTVNTFMGDYLQCVSDNGACYPVWPDTRPSNAGIYSAVVPRVQPPGRKRMPGAAPSA